MIDIYKNPNILKIIEQGVEAGIATICSNVRSQAVVDAPVAIKNGGRLKSSITWKTEKSDGGGDWSGMPQPKKLEGYVGSNVEYAVYVEFGTRYMRPQPYLRTAIAIKALGQRGADVMVKKQEQAARDKIKLSAMTDRETYGIGKGK